jgi:hypothetical protein
MLKATQARVSANAITKRRVGRIPTAAPRFESGRRLRLVERDPEQVGSHAAAPRQAVLRFLLAFASFLLAVSSFLLAVASLFLAFRLTTRGDEQPAAAPAIPRARQAGWRESHRSIVELPPEHCPHRTRASGRAGAIDADLKP